MNQKIDLVILPFHDLKKWKKEGFRTRDAHLYEHFSKNDKVNKILLINRPVSLAERIIKGKKWKTEEGEVVLEKRYWRLCKINEKEYYIDLKSNDFFSVILLKKAWWNKIFNDKNILEAIEEALIFLKMENRIILLQNPMAVGFVKKINKRMFIFDAIDNWLYHPQMNKYNKIISKNYNYIKENSDIIFTVSENLKRFFGNRKNVYWIPNGVDKEKFSNNQANNFAGTIGYIGKIQDRVDFELIEKCLNAYKNIKFLMVGPIYSQNKKVRYLTNTYSNIEFFGDIPYEQLPMIMSKIDIAIIPHKVDDFTESMNPLKVYEYLAAGKQVVSTKIAGIDCLSDYIYQSNDNRQFIEFINIAINKKKEDENIEEKVRDSLSNEHTWEKISEKIIDIIEEAIC